MLRVNHGQCPIILSLLVDFSFEGPAPINSAHSAERFPLLHSPIFPARRVAAASLMAALSITIVNVAVDTPAGAAALPKFAGAAWSKPIGPTHLSSPVI